MLLGWVHPQAGPPFMISSHRWKRQAYLLGEPPPWRVPLSLALQQNSRVVFPLLWTGCMPVSQPDVAARLTGQVWVTATRHLNKARGWEWRSVVSGDNWDLSAWRKKGMDAILAKITPCASCGMSSQPAHCNYWTSIIKVWGLTGSSLGPRLYLICMWQIQRSQKF